MRYDLVSIKERYRGMGRSLLATDLLNPHIGHLLNKNGLCSTVDDVNKIIPYQDHGEVEWEPCYVYKVIL